ncbi:hypothetical protein ABZ733_22610 [Streptomyces longwoodensis]|uniref:hypothetical protein n=1 Tax=Streptomyces longwoodensis TaxID=68231 RepID=UPI003407B038
MSPQDRSHRYVGPVDLLHAVRPGSGGRSIGSAAAFAGWIAEQAAAELSEPFPLVVGTDGVLRPAPRRSEHVMCAGGETMLSAGEIGFVREAGHWVAEVSNHSTGYCPDESSWPAVARALDDIGLRRPPGFTHPVVFRRCPRCQEHAIVREGHFVCVFCGAESPDTWNVDPGARRGPGRAVIPVRPGRRGGGTPPR